MKKSLLMFLILSVMAIPAAANMSGCWAEVRAPYTANPGDTVVFEIYYENQSPDGEGTNSVVAIFPETYTILQSWYDDLGQGWDYSFSASGDFGSIAHFDATTPQMMPGTGGHFFLEVFIRPNNPCGPFTIRWKQYGDRTGTPDHWISGLIEYDLCGVPTQDSNWSSIKSLY
jgi:hypothetical protein